MIRASDLIGCIVQTESGAKIGRVHDLRAHRTDDGWLLVGLVVGPGGLLARLLGGGSDAEPANDGQLIAWQAISSLDYGRITISDALTDPSTRH